MIRLMPAPIRSSKKKLPFHKIKLLTKKKGKKNWVCETIMTVTTVKLRGGGL